MREITRRFADTLRIKCQELLPLYIGTTHERAGTKIIRKEDGTPVIDLDTYALDQLRSLIASCFPNDFILGEEDKRTDEEIQEILREMDEYQWTVDGLDGTWHFIRGSNSYGAMVSCRYGDEILFTGIFHPADMALRGNGFFYATTTGAWQWCREHDTYHQIQTAASGQLERLTVMVEGPSKKFFEGRMLKLGAAVTTRCSLSSCVAATIVATGNASAVVTVGHKPWDGWPILGMVRAAGGVVTDHQGNLATPMDCSKLVAAANQEDSAKILSIMNS